MFIDGLVSSVGPVYAAFMERSLPVWAATLDSVTLVTEPDDPVVPIATRLGRVRVVQTDVFRRHGAAFNKGAALSQAYALMDPTDAVLHFDADIMPPPDWRAAAEAGFSEGCIHGAVRNNEDGSRITDLGDWPYGYFQLWHSSDPAAMRWPLFEVWHPSAGGYDLEFLEHWPKARRRKLGFEVTHFGEVRRNWFGAGLPEAAQADAFARMDKVHAVGLRETRLRTRRPENRLKVPPFALRFLLQDNKKSPERVRALVRACMTDDPFLVELGFDLTAPRRPSSGRRPERLLTTVKPEALRERVVAAYRERHGRPPG